MDHLPHPQDAALPPVKVPYYDKFKYDGDSFTDFPVRCGFDKSGFPWGDFQSVPWKDHTAFFQAWLFFGVLHEFFGSLDLEQFVDRTNGNVTTAALPKVAQKWQKGLPLFSKKQKFAVFQRVNKCLKEMRDTVAFLNHLRSKDGLPLSSVTEEVCHSIIVLGLTLEEIRNYHHGFTPDGGMDNEERLEVLVGAWPTSRLARKRLESGGLCKSSASKLEKYIFSTGMVYCGSMKSFGRAVDHSRCLENRCNAEDVDEATYRTAHAKSCLCHDHLDACTHADRCEHTGPLVDDISRIITLGSFPVIALTKTKSTSEVRISVEPYKKSISYTAITHVWADGLGNPDGNTLPACQFSRLYSSLDSLSDRNEGLSLARNAWSRLSKKDTVYLWIDTLCIPREKALRKKAINLMYSVYQKATKVLLLDESLLNIPSKRPMEELCFRITASPWMRRAWTLQEGALASTLFAQFADGPLHVESAIESLARRTTGTESYNITLKESWITLKYVQSCRPGMDDAPVTLVHSGLIDRSTTHEEDKELCMAIMLACDMQPIQEAKGEERTKRIYEQMQYVPDSFFWHKNACLGVPGLRWAPKDLWATQTSGSMSRSRLHMKDGRLIVQAPGMVYRARSHYITKPSPHIRDSVTGRWYILRWHEDEAYERIASKSHTGWTVLAIILKIGAMASPIREGVVISLEWAWQAKSLPEFSDMIHSRGDKLDGVFVGRASLEELDEEDTAKLSGEKAKHKDIEQMREDIRTGKTRFEDLETPPDEMHRRILLEDDDSWWVFDGEMLDQRQMWSVE